MKIIGFIPDYLEYHNLPKGKPKFYGDLNFYATRANYIEAIQNEIFPQEDIGVIIIPLVIGNEKYYADLIHGLVISGNGKDINPKYYNQELSSNSTIENVRTEFEFSLIKEMDKQKKPVLGICGGCQSINVAFGGSLIQDLKSTKRNHNLKGECHNIDITEGTKLHHIFNAKTIVINSYHNQAVDKTGKGLIINCISPDGVVEGIEKKDHPFLVGVQWHPEFHVTDFDKTLFRAFIEAVVKAT